MPSNKCVLATLCVLGIPGFIISGIVFGFSIYGIETIGDRIIDCELECTVFRNGTNCFISLENNSSSDDLMCPYDGNCDNAPFMINCEINNLSNETNCLRTDCGTESTLNKQISFAGVLAGGLGLIIFIIILIISFLLMCFLICK